MRMNEREERNRRTLRGWTCGFSSFELEVCMSMSMCVYVYVYVCLCLCMQEYVLTLF